MQSTINLAIFILSSAALIGVYEWLFGKFEWQKFRLPFSALAAVITSVAVILALPDGLPTFPEGKYMSGKGIAFEVIKVDSGYEATSVKKYQDFDGNMKNGRRKPGPEKNKTIAWSVSHDEYTVTLMDLPNFKVIRMTPIDGSNKRYMGSDGYEYHRQ